MGTIIENIFSYKLDREVTAGETVISPVDWIISHDNTTPLAIEAWAKTNKPLASPDKIVIHFDHCWPPANGKAAKAQNKILEFIAEEQINNFYHEGVCHQIMLEKLVTPGQIIVGGDSHTCTYGALGAFSTGMGSTDIAVSYTTGKNWFIIPETILVKLEGNLSKGSYAKDIILHLAGLLTAEGANYKVLEFEGSYIQQSSIDERATLCNMAVEMGAKGAIIYPDKTTQKYLKQQNRGPCSINFPPATNAIYYQEIEINVEKIEPTIAIPHQVDQVKPISQISNISFDKFFIGTCTNGRLSDLEITANILKGKKIPIDKTLIIVPASVQIYKIALEKGFIDTFLDAGAVICNPGCGPCIGRHQGVLAKDEKALTTMNRNFQGRMGSPQAEIYLASPATVAISSLSGKLENPSEF